MQAPAAGTSSLSGAAGQSSAARAPGRQTLGLSAAAQDTPPARPGPAPPPDYPFLAPPQGPEELGRLGGYRILGVLGAGAMGVVFQAEDPHLKRLVALKVLRPSLAASADFHRRFLREAQLAAAIEHEHLVTVYQAGEDRGVPFLAMKLLRGETLEERLQRAGGRLPLAAVLRVGREIAEGLAAAHAAGLIHRDIKPANIWLEEATHADAGALSGGRVKIVDFGLARGSEPDAQFTQAGAVIGTPAYMAPEQANAAAVDARCDLFSLGVVLYRACTGRLPFGGKDTLSVLSALATQTPPPPHRLVPALPRACSALVMRLLAKDPADRPQSAREVVEALAALERAPVAAPEVRCPGGKEAASPRAVAEGTRRRAAPGGAKREGPKKARQPASRGPQPVREARDWGRLVLAAALVLLGVAVLVLLAAAVRHATKARAAPRVPPVATRTASPSSCRTGAQAELLARRVTADATASQAGRRKGAANSTGTAGGGSAKAARTMPQPQPRAWCRACRPGRRPAVTG